VNELSFACIGKAMEEISLKAFYSFLLRDRLEYKPEDIKIALLHLFI